MSCFLITGGTGMVGRALCRYLMDNGHKAIVLTRQQNKQPSTDGIQYTYWNVEDKQMDAAILQQCDYIIHLAGASIAGRRWSSRYKKEIENSRIQSSALLVDTLRSHPHRIKAIISASGIGWYGKDRIPGKAFTECDEAGEGFLSNVCRLWEAGISEAGKLGIPVVCLRIGMVLSNEEGLLSRLKKALQWGIVGIPGNGTQIVSWIHIEDLCRMMVFAAQHIHVQGSMNAVATMPVSIKELSLQYARSRKKRFILLYVPGFLLRLLLGPMANEALKSITVSNRLIKEKGFQFKYAGIAAAMEALATDRSL